MHIDSLTSVAFLYKYLGNAEIDQLELVAVGLYKEEVFWFNISMNYIFAMHILYGLHELNEVASSFVFRIPSTF